MRLITRSIAVVSIFIVVFSNVAGAVTPPPEVLDYADMVLYNGQVLTADADRNFTVARAVAVRDGRILKVGTDDEILPLAGPDTRRIDLKGRSVTPGFIYSDGDNSVPAGDLEKDSQWAGTIQPRVRGSSIEDVENKINEIVKNEVRPGEIVYIRIADQWAGPIMEAWDKSTVDELSPNNPTMIIPDCCHAIANSKLIKLMLEKGFPKDHLHLIKDSRGNPTGQLGSIAEGFVGREMRPMPPPEWVDQHVAAANKEMEKYAKEGITSATGHMTGLSVLILNRLFSAKELPIRVFPALDLIRQNAFPERTLKRVGDLMDFALSDDRGPMVQIVGTSAGPLSGAPDAAISLLTIEPKTRIVPDLGKNPHGYDRWSGEYYTGKTTSELTGDELKDTEYYNVMLARRYGYNVLGMHTMGSRAILLSMQDIVDANDQKDLYVPKLSRANAFDHDIDWLKQDYDYYKKHENFLSKNLRLGISLKNVLSQRDAKVFGYTDVLSLQYGWKGLERMAPLHTLLVKNIPFHIEGTDPGEPPMHIIKGAVMRVDRKGRKVAPGEALTREQALLAITRWAARFISAEESLGSIEQGKWADLVVFNGNILNVPIEDIDRLHAVLTLVGGRVAYQGEGL